MKDLYKYLLESEKDGKGGHYEDFVDEDTGEIVTLWVPDPDPELEKKKWEIYQKHKEEIQKLYDKCAELDKENKKKLEKLEDEMWGYEQDLKNAKRNYRQLQIDMEEELGQLYTSGKEYEAEEKAQEYGSQFNDLSDEIDSLK